MAISRKEDKELVQSILGGEMRNSWQKGDGIDYRKEKGGGWNGKSTAYLSNYAQIFKRSQK